MFNYPNHLLEVLPRLQSGAEIVRLHGRRDAGGGDAGVVQHEAAARHQLQHVRDAARSASMNNRRIYSVQRVDATVTWKD